MSKPKLPKLKLCVLDQSPIAEGSTAAEAFANTLELAQAADRWGYSRYWVAEHHGSTGFAGSSPEILVSHLAAQTDNIRVGSGGVMLSHYSPLKVAENFKILQTLHPDRIDLGIGRAPGSDGLTAAALAYGSQIGMEYFGARVADTLAFLTNDRPMTEALENVHATPHPDIPPQVWLLGSSDQSAQLAARFGLAFSFAHFIEPHMGFDIVRQYREAFRPSKHFGVPRVSVGVTVICADTQDEVDYISASHKLWRLRFEQGTLGAFPSPEDSLGHPYTDVEEAMINRRTRHGISGTPDKVKAQLEEFAMQYQCNELVVLTICYDQKARMRSYELLSEAFELDRP
jgi:luciferase family oxidoreductase group 1